MEIGHKIETENIMRYKYLFSIVVGFVFLLGITNLSYSQSNSAQKLRLSIDSPKKLYKLGEVINLSFALTNESDKPITFLDIFGTGSGYLNLEISQNNEDFYKFSHPRWGRLDGDGTTTLKPNETVTASANIFWEWVKQDVPAAAFIEPGIYRIKARYNIHIEKEENSILMKSEPVQITLEQPVGEDLQVWNIIKNNGDIAHFIQEGYPRIPDYKPEERARFLREVEQIIIDHPNSFYAESLRRSLDKFEAAKARLEKLYPKN